jgi:hypothetical protein
VTRAEYLSKSLTRLRPWEDWDISRRTWYTRRSRRESERMQALIERLAPSEKRELRRLMDGGEGA